GRAAVLSVLAVPDLAACSRAVPVVCFFAALSLPCVLPVVLDLVLSAVRLRLCALLAGLTVRGTVVPCGVHSVAETVPVVR
ncbi:unnamed protein product, partial [Closterium sp. NIES-54]